MKKSTRQSQPHSKVMNAVSAWISSHDFSDELKQLSEADPLMISFKQSLLDQNLSFHFSSDAADALLAMMIYIDDAEIPAEKRNFIREWISYRNTSLDVGAFQMEPNSKNIYYFASIDTRGIEDVDSQFISNIYMRGRAAVAMHMNEFLNLTKN
jgi:hypothetical protein